MQGSFFLDCHTKNATADAFAIKRIEGSTGVLLLELHEADASASPRHYVGS